MNPFPKPMPEIFFNGEKVAWLITLSWNCLAFPSSLELQYNVTYDIYITKIVKEMDCSVLEYNEYSFSTRWWLFGDFYYEIICYSSYHTCNHIEIELSLWLFVNWFFSKSVQFCNSTILSQYPNGNFIFLFPIKIIDIYRF